MLTNKNIFKFFKEIHIINRSMNLIVLKNLLYNDHCRINSKRNSTKIRRESIIVYQVD